MTGKFHPKKHPLNSIIDHNGVPSAVINELMKFDADGLPALSGLKHVFVSRAVPETGFDYVEIGKFTQAQGSFAIIVAVSSIDTGALSGSDLYYIVGKYDETAATWQLAYPIQTIEPHSQLCVMIDDDELHLRLIAISSTMAPVTMKVQIVDMGVGNAIFTAASGTGSMGLPGTTFPSALISQYGGVVHVHGEMSMNTEKITDVIDPTAAQGVATKNYVDTLISFAKAMKEYHVSKSKGSDTLGDGGPYKPFATVNKAVTIGEAAYNAFAISLDNDNYSSEAITITKIVCISGLGGIHAGATRPPGTMTVNGGSLVLDNLYFLNTIVTDGVSPGSVYIEECAAFFSAGGMSGITGNFYLYDTEINDANPMTKLPAGWRGSFYNTGLGWYFSDGINMHTTKIINLADGVGAQDGAAFGQIGSAIGTHTGLPNAHHAEVHGISDNTKHTGALVNDNITLGDANGLVKDSGVSIGSIVGGMNYQGTWDASSNTPTLADGTGTKGHIYEVSVAGSQDLGSGSITFEIGDYLAHNGSIWQKIDRIDIITSVFTRVGAIVAQASDYDASQVDNDSGVSGSFVDDALDQLDSDKIDNALFDTNTILRSIADDTPTALTVPEQRLLGRITAGNIEALTIAQVQTLLGMVSEVTKKGGIVAGGSFAGNPKKFTVTFNTAMPDNNYAISVTSEDSRNWTIESKAAAGFVINANSNLAFTGNVFWIARPINDP